MQNTINLQEIPEPVVRYINHVSEELNVEPTRIIDNILTGFCARQAALESTPILEFTELRGKELFQAIYNETSEKLFHTI